ncbi:putative SPRY domain, concanavalin A-like lectin/glucanase domain-containing protein [Rosa chinensis]|uniref:Putative SPRY domain, concanavalin A-like lectin/glucanase domain-containing protein n=1 Tax=Rosa chinensis TaxID=74649 RepID=A0A2P6PI03_ROSCH|nr:putative SPRY domain, concanavalin A-like lectin/glucanase domain-containing protein [Rosa chinensis]
MEDTDPEDQNLCRVDISRGDNVVGSLGETSHSFGYEGTGKFWNAMRSPCYGEKFGLGDTIVCAVSLEEKPLASISFSKNGKCLGTAMKFNAAMDPEVKNFQWEFAFFPQLLLKNVEVELQFSVEDELVLEDGFKPCLAALRDGNAIGGPVFDDPKDCEMMMMVGMPASGKTTGAKKWVKDHPEKRYVFVGINMVFDQMKIAVVVFPSPEEVKARLLQRFDDLGFLVHAKIMNELLATFVLPVSKDVTCSDEFFDEVMFVELNRDESHNVLEEMKQEESDLNSNDSSPYSCKNFDESYPFSPNYGGSHVLLCPTLSPQYKGAST